MELMKLNGLGWKLKKNEIFPEIEKEVQIVVKSNNRKNEDKILYI